MYRLRGWPVKGAPAGFQGSARHRWKCLYFGLSCWLLLQGGSHALAQLDVLSKGDLEESWRQAQISVLQQQLDDGASEAGLREELQAQLDWLTSWRPGSLTAEPARAAAPESEPITEPNLDPHGTIEDLRARLLGPDASPTVADTGELKQMLQEHSTDVGVRQLHLQWLDQLHYRKQYCDAIAEAAGRLLSMLNDAELDDDRARLARAFALYRRCRALAYRELPEVLDERPLEDPVAHDAALVGAYRELQQLVGRRPEFVLIDVRMLRRDRAFGRALELLEQYGAAIDKKWYLKKRRDLLRELGWSAPAEEAAAIYAQEFPEAAAEEAST